MEMNHHCRIKETEISFIESLWENNISSCDLQFSYQGSSFSHRIVALKFINIKKMSSIVMHDTVVETDRLMLQMNESVAWREKKNPSDGDDSSFRV